MCLEYVKQAFAAYKRNFKAVIGAILLLSLTIFVLAIVALAPLGFSVVNLVMNGMTDPSAIMSTLLKATTSLSLSAVLLALTVIIGIALNVGAVKVYADAVKGKARAMDIFSVAREKWLTALGATTVIGLIFGAVIFALSLTAVISPLLTTVLVSIAIAYLIASFAFVNVSIVVNNLSAIAAVKNSMNFSKQNFWATIMLVIGFLVIDFILDFIPLGGLINFILVGPVFSLSLISLYLNRIKMRSGTKNKRAKRR